MSDRNKVWRTYRTVVLAVGSFLALVFLLAFVPKIILMLTGNAPKLPAGREWEGKVMAAMSLTYMVGYGLGWWRFLWGGVIILLSAIVVSAPFIIREGQYSSLIFGIPIFIVGLLYLFLHWFEKQHGMQKKK